jgi:hypothetical protein
MCDELVERSNQGEDWGIRDHDYFDKRRGHGFHNDPRNDGLGMQQIRDKILQEFAVPRALGYERFRKFSVYFYLAPCLMLSHYLFLLPFPIFLLATARRH